MVKVSLKQRSWIEFEVKKLEVALCVIIGQH